MNSEKFKQLCDGVWQDRAAILTGCGNLSGEAALIRAVYWRLRKAGGGPGADIEACDPAHMALSYQRMVGSTLVDYAQPPFDSTPLLKELVGRYISEVG